jgi:hypothetical protein
MAMRQERKAKWMIPILISVRNDEAPVQASRLRRLQLQKNFQGFHFQVIHFQV